MMMSKRRFDEQEGDGAEVSVQESKRRLGLVNIVGDVLRGFSTGEIASVLEPILRKVVREEVERIVQLLPNPRSTLNQVDSSEVIDWQLHFVNKLPSTIYTSSRIEAEDHSPVEVVILDTKSKARITSGPLSSLKIKILALDGNFGTGDRENWTEKEFNDHIMYAREGKRPLVTGELDIVLRNGGGLVDDVIFTDNSSWTRSGRFRLGAQAVQNSSSAVRVREGRSSAFVVRDQRGESYRKHHPPALGDEVWRLERIAKDGKLHKQLASKGIRTVEDFLQVYETNPSSLRMIVGSRISDRIWDKIIDHVNECVNYQSYTSQMIASSAYKNVNDLIGIGNPSIVGLSRPSLSPQADPPDPDCQFTQEDQWETQLSNNSTLPTFTHDSTLLACSYQDSSLLEVSAAKEFHPTLRNSFVIRDIWSGSYNGVDDWVSGGSSSFSLPAAGQSADDDDFNIQTSSWAADTGTWGERNGFFFGSSSRREADCSFPSPLPHFGVSIASSGKGKPNVAWCKIWAAVKWRILIRRYVAAKRMAQFPYQNYHSVFSC